MLTAIMQKASPNYVSASGSPLLFRHKIFYIETLYHTSAKKSTIIS